MIRILQSINILMMFLLVSVSASAVEERFQDTNEGIILDTETGLMWTKNSLLATLRKVEVNEYISNYTLSGYLDWRAPTESEIEELVEGLRIWDAYDNFQNLKYDGGGCNNPQEPTFIAQDGSGFNYHIRTDCNGNTAKRIEDLPDNDVAVWLVRSGPHSEQRFTQAEVDVIRNDAYKQGLSDAGEKRSEFAPTTGNLTIPAINVFGSFGDIKVYEATLNYIPNSNPLAFTISTVNEITD